MSFYTSSIGVQEGKKHTDFYNIYYHGLPMEQVLKLINLPIEDYDELHKKYGAIKSTHIKGLTFIGGKQADKLCEYLNKKYGLILKMIV